MKMTKKIILLSSLAAMVVAYVFSEPVLFGICRDTYTFGNHVGCLDKLPELIISLLFVFVPILLLTLITYKIRDEVFRAWWNFARWWVPVIILVTYLQSTQSGGSGMGIGGAMSSAVDAITLGFFYAVLVIVSLWRIVHKYRQLKRESK